MNFFQKNRLSPLLGVMFFITVCVFASCQKSDTPIVMKDDASMSGVEALKNAAEGTQAKNSTWTTNPFQTGNMVSTGSALKFRKPNTEWKSRTIQLKDGRWLSYEFGKGNPASVALDQEALNKLVQECLSQSGSIQNVLHTECSVENARPYYVFPETEKYLFDAFSDENWRKLASECQNAFQYADSVEHRRNISYIPLSFSQSDASSSFDPSYETVFGSGFLDINDFLQINPETGRKLVHLNKLNSLIHFLENSRQFIGSGEPLKNPYGDCVGQYGSGILSNLYQVRYSYQTPEWKISTDLK